MFSFNRKKRKNKKEPEVYSSLTANGVDIEALNISMQTDKNGTHLLYVYTKGVCEALHFSEVDFVLKTKLKQINIKGVFDKAADEKRFKLYIFKVLDYNQFYI